MTTPSKKSRRPKAGTPAAPVEAAAPRSLPGDFYWESRIAAWLGVPRKRLAQLRRRALREIVDWQVDARQQEIVYTPAGLKKLQGYLAASGHQKPTAVSSKEDNDTPAPAGPLERAIVVIMRVLPNRRMMSGELTVGEKRQAILIRVRDNENFMAGMKVPVVHDPRNSTWQFVGRLPRRKGRL